MTRPALAREGSLSTCDGRPLVLERTAVQARIHGPVARVELSQRFVNDTGQTIEAVYSFPLPPEASVERMSFRIRDRVVRAVVKAREEARRDYEAAMRQGRAATLLEEDRPALFTLAVANIPAGESIEVRLEYSELLALDDGQWQWVFPMVAPERYLEAPAGPEDGAVRGPRRPSGSRPGDVQLEVRVAGVVADLSCASHPVVIEEGDGGRVVRLAAPGRIANRDFVLRFRAGGPGVRPLVLFERDAGQPGTFLLMIAPPPPEEVRPADAGAMKAVKCGNCGAAVSDARAIKEVPGLGIVVPCDFCGALLAPATQVVTRATRPRDVVVLVDRSASMRGAVAQARRAVGAILAGLGPGDAVQVLACDHERLAFDDEGAHLLAIAPEVVARADAFLAGLAARGGTELEAALERAAKLPVRPERTSCVVLVTDAAIGNEGRLVRRVPELVGRDRRLHVLGVGPAVDRRLVARLARAGGGASEVITDAEDASLALARFARRVRDGGPVLTGLSLAWEGALVTMIHPGALPDLFGSQPVRVLGRFAGTGASRLVLTGAAADGRPFRQELELALPAECHDAEGLVRLWARARVDALTERMAAAPREAVALKQEVRALGLAHALVTPETSLVAEDSEVVAAGGPQQRLQVEGEPAPEDRADRGEKAGRGGEPRERKSEARRGEEPRVMAELAPAPLTPPAVAAVSPRPPAPAGMVAPAAMAPPPPAAMEDLCLESSACVDMSSEVDLSAGLGGGGDLIDELLAPPPVASAPPGRVAPSGGGAAMARAQSLQAEPPGSEAYEADELRWLSHRASGQLDLVCLVDETGSMGPYIDAVKARILDIIAALKDSPLCKSLRIGVVSYRDHPPQDHSYASRVFPLTEAVDEVRAAVNALAAQGGGDGPESVTDGLVDVVRLPWRPGAARAVVWFGDAPPHGVEPGGDGFPAGCPCGQHWYTQAENCREMGIAVYAVGCLPALRQYVGAESVFRTVAATTRGTYLPLENARLLVHLIAGAALAALDRQRIDERIVDVVAEHAAALAGTDEPERVHWLTETLRARGMRPRDMAYDPATKVAPPLKFRDLEDRDVEGALDRLRAAGRIAI